MENAPPRKNVPLLVLPIMIALSAPTNAPHARAAFAPQAAAQANAKRNALAMPIAAVAAVAVQPAPWECVPQEAAQASVPPFAY